MQESDVIVVGVAVVGGVYDKRTDTAADFMIMISLLCPSSQVHKQVGCADTEYTDHRENNITRTKFKSV